jgi:hypothetical protein
MQARQGADHSHVDLTNMGVPADQAQAWLAAQQPEDQHAEGTDEGDGQPLAVWPENWPALGLFLRLQTQWVKDAAGHREGLRHESIESALNLKVRDADERSKLYDHLVEMEHAALEALNGV